MLVNGCQYRSGSVFASNFSSSQQQQHQAPIESRRFQHTIATHSRTLPILDYVPNWSPSSGGTKVLLIGNWKSLLEDSSLAPTKSVHEFDGNAIDSNAFGVLFGDLLVPATLIQDNVIRCYSPRHELGYKALKVLYKDLIVSEQVLFEIRPSVMPPNSSSSSGGSGPTVQTSETSQERFAYSQPAQDTKELIPGGVGNTDMQCTSQNMDSTCIT